MGEGARFLVSALLLLSPLALARHDDDFAFDNGEEFQVELTANHSDIARNSLRRLWGVPDTSAYVGHLFRMEIPKEAFSGEVVAYKVRGPGDRRAPNWLAVDSKHGLVTGVPMERDLGSHVLTVTAHGRTPGLSASDSFTILVKRAQEKPQTQSCKPTESRMGLVIILDVHYNRLQVKQKIRALMELAKFMALSGDEFSMEPYKSRLPDDVNYAVLVSGPGSSQRRRSDGSTAINLRVGCGGKLWPRHKVLVAGIREQARDGTLAALMKLPVLGWRLASERPPRQAPDVTRNKRQSKVAEGSGSYNDYDDGEGDYGDDYSGDGGDDEDYADNADPLPINPEPPTDAVSPKHHHRHHHGEPNTPEPTPTLPPTTLPPTTTTDLTTSTRASTTTDPTTLLTTQADTTTNTLLTSEATTYLSTGRTTDLTTLTEPLSTDTLTQSVSTPLPSQGTNVPVTSAEEDLLEPESRTTNANVTEDQTAKEVQIVPYSANGMDRAPPAATTRPRKLDVSPVIIVPEAPTTVTEATQPTVMIEPSSEPTTPELRKLTPITTTSSTTTTTTTARPTIRTTTTTTTVKPPTTTTAKPITTTTTAKPATTTTTTAKPSTTTTTTAKPITTTTTTTTTTEPPVPDFTLQEKLSSTDRTSTIFGQTTETIEFDVRAPSNQPPVQQNPIQKLTAIAGKAFRYIIPDDVFFDPEDGKNLSLRMYDSNMVELKPTSWVQLLPKSREVYGLPLEEHVSIWYYKIQARDSQGATVRGKLDIKVNEHKGKRTVNHEFVLTLKLNQTYAKPVNWQIRVLEGLVNVFSDSDMDNITVRSVVQKDDLIDFTWTNDSLPRDVCPTSQIERLMAVMEAPGSKGEPSPRLAAMMSPQVRPVAVRWRGLGVCAPATDPPPVPAPAQTPPQIRNQVDHVEAVAGHLLVYKVPEDTFFDPEDGPTRKLKLSLVGGDYTPLDASHWMQFDKKNQEFYGLPSERDVGHREYQLIAEDPTGKTAFDSLEVVVKSAAEYSPTVEFQMTLEHAPGRLFDAKDKRKLVEKIAELFGDKDTSSIRIKSITDNPTTIVWHNTSLTSSACPHEQIQALKKIIIHEEKDGRQEMLTEHVDEIFDNNFKVMSMRLIPMGLCSDAETGIKSVQAGDRGQQGGHESRGAITFDDYLITYIIPVVVVVCMVLIAGVIACVLYRRRKTGKMSVGDEEERQAFRSKGIPVIFQDELDDKPEPSHKSPVIMQEEKPPLLPPPEYRQGESATHSPYRPPPPFTTSRDSSRPKPAPSYRKPPPYVPP